ncbi:histidine triad nucleotide-binding protein [Halobacteriovorax marinus]|uniref:Histidine triad nucleotide-binding protein n=1 Tax=Halobacteriovorax marinus TaxID=97084 RepID=A0A1Y5FA53_9BACT|nr:histidine triad nucleotide-binding protein [Halobacteriovorax marinus]
MSDCLFCKIIKGDIPSQKIYEDDFVFGFKDLNPMAKIHHLFVHKEHTGNVNELVETSPKQLADVYLAISKFSKESDLEREGFRVVTNVGPNAGQTVFHTHFHVLGGERLGHFGS